MNALADFVGDEGLAAAINALVRETGGELVLTGEGGQVGRIDRRCVIVKAGGRRVLRIESVMSANAAPPHYIAAWVDTTGDVR